MCRRKCFELAKVDRIAWLKSVSTFYKITFPIIVLYQLPDASRLLICVESRNHILYNIIDDKYRLNASFESTS